MHFFLLFIIWFLFCVNGSCYSNIESDIVFVLDSSGSIDTDDWNDMLEFVGDLVLDSLPSNARVGCLVFGTDTYVEFGLNQYDNKEDIAAHIKEDTIKLRETTQTLKALEDAYDQIFVADWDPDQVKKLILFTDGRPDSDSDPCLMATTLKASGIEVFIVAVGDWLDSTNMDCLVNDAESEIFDVGDFSLLEDVFTDLEEVICANDFDFNIIEVQPYPGTSPRFIEIYNGGGEIEAYDLEFSGLYTGTITESTIVPQGDILLVSDDSSLSSDCGSGCVFYHWNQGVTSYTQQDSDGTILEGYSVELTHSGNVIAESIYASDFPKLKQGYSFELNLVVSNPSVGSNQRESCDLGGSPGVLPVLECGSCSTNDECQFQGDTAATCVDNECTCSTGFYPEGPTCEVLPAPTDCMVHGVDGEAGRYYIDWTQPDFMNSATFSGTEIYFYLGGDIAKVTLTFPDAPPTSSFEIAEQHRELVQVTSMFTKNETLYLTNKINCTVIEAPTMFPSEAPTNVPTRLPTRVPSVSVVPTVDECTLRILDNTMTDAVISWVYTGDYVVNDVNEDPSGFQLSWGETTTSLASTVAFPSNEWTVSLLAKWNYTDVVAEVIVEGYELATVLSDSMACTVAQATPSPVAYPVPAPDDCTALVAAGGEIAEVTITPPSSVYTPDNEETQVGYLVRVTDNFITNYELGYDGNVLSQTVIIDEDDFVGISAISLGTETDGSTTIHPESDATPCKILTNSPTTKPSAPDAQFPVPAIQSCDVLVAPGSQGTTDSVQVTLSWVPPDEGEYNDNGTPLDLYGFMYKLGGESSWVTVAGKDVNSYTDLWNRNDADEAKKTYMKAVGLENVGGEDIYPISDGEVPCSITTFDPTNFPTRSPTRSPTSVPTRAPTSAPTFDIPEVAFVPTDFTTNAVSYEAKESSSDYISFTLSVGPASLLPIMVRWELIDNSTGLQPTSGFHETNGTVSIGEYKENYKAECTQGVTCIAGYTCISHLVSDYCVKNVDAVYEEIQIMAYDDSIVHNDVRSFKLCLSAGGSYNDNEFYGNDDHYRVDDTLSEATLNLYDADGAEFCIAVPTDPSCSSSNVVEGLLWWHYLISVVVLIIVIALLYFAYRKHMMAKEAKLQKRRLDNELDNELRNQEEDFGVGPTDTVNPLALRAMQQGGKRKTKMGPTQPIESDDEDIEGGVSGFNTKVQFDQNG